jgi:serine/threonine protein phosphatase PrpC
MPDFFHRLTKKSTVNQFKASSDPKIDHAGNAQITYPMQYIVGSGQSVGLQREHNEDALFTLSSVLSDGKSEETFGLFIIADGMGGHKNGEIASSVTARVVSRYIIDQLYNILTEPQLNTPALSVQEILTGAVNEAQKSVVQYAPGGGTTLTIALLLGNQLTIAHVGDSRAYFILSDGKLQKITSDDSLVQRLVDLKEIKQEEADKHPQKNILLKAVGQPDPYQPEIFTMPIPDEAGLLLCSDGLWGVVSENRISEIVMSMKNPVIACQKLVAAANEGGGPDNISVIYVRISGIE